MKTSRTSAALSLAVLGALTLVSCGGGSEGGDSEASQEEICADVQGFADAVGTVDASESQEDALAAFDGAADAADVLRDSVPAEISDDVALLADGLRTLSDAETGEEVGAALEELDQDALDAASDRFETYADETCGIDF